MDCEVLVVGAGPAGSTAARLLAKEGIDTLLVEKNLSFNKPCGGGIPSAGLKEFGLLEHLKKELRFNVIKKVKIVPPLSSPIEVTLEGGDILIFDRHEFDTFLRKLADKSGARLIEGELISIEQKKGKISSSVETKNGNILKINSRYLIAADGVNSKVCSLLRFERPDYLWTVSFQIPKVDNVSKDTCEFWFGSSHASFFYSWVFPGVNHVSVGTGSDKAYELKKLIQNFVHKRFPQLEGFQKFSLRAYKIPRWKKRRFSFGNILLCGDALGTVMPVTFEGIYYAMKSGEFAAEAIKEGNPKTYEKIWRDRFGRQFRLMKKFQDFMFGDDRRIDQWLEIHRDQTIQKIAMSLWLRKERGSRLIPLYLKGFSRVIPKLFI